MKFVTVKGLRASPADIWKQLPSEREMIVTSNGKPIALITPINDELFDDTVTAVRRARALNAMKRMQEISVSLGNNKMTLEKINAVIKDVRGKSKK